MRRFFLFLALAVFTSVVHAQIMRTEELEKYAKERFGEKWVDAAANLGGSLSLDKNRSLTYMQVVECPGMTRDQLYVILNYWFTATFNDDNCAIQLNDKDLGCIIAEGYMYDIAGHVGGMNAYVVSIHPVIKVDIKDGKVRVTYTVQNYEVIKSTGGGWVGAIAGTPTTNVAHEKWGLDTCYPFIEKDGHKAKKTSSKALIMTHAYSNVIIDKIEEVVKNGLVGNEGDDW